MLFSIVETTCAFQGYSYPATDPSAVFSAAVDATSQSQTGKREIAPFTLSSEWITDSETGLVTAEATATIPLLFIRTPPPLVKVGFAYTDLFGAEEFGLPDDLYEYSIGFS